jgi:hypothetical protein
VPYYPRHAINALKQHGLLWWNNGNGTIDGVPRDTSHTESG